MTLISDRNQARRNQWISNALHNLPSGGRILDAGAGEQPYRSDCEHLQYISQDFAQYAPEADERGFQMDQWDYGKLDLVCDVCAIPEDDGSFDAVLCSEVLEHIPNPAAAIHEFGRLLKKGGVLLLTAPFASMTHFAPHHYATGFSRFYYQHHLEEAGFEIEEIDVNGNYFEYLATLLELLPAITERYASQALPKRQKKCVHYLLAWLKTIQGETSSELLAYGIHVKAVRR